jgi:hypothetical protein
VPANGGPGIPAAKGWDSPAGSLIPALMDDEAFEIGAFDPQPGSAADQDHRSPIGANPSAFQISLPTP